MLFEEIIISSNGRTIERIRNAQYIQHCVHQFQQSRPQKAKRREEGFSNMEDDTYQKYEQGVHGIIAQADAAGAVGEVLAQAASGVQDHGYSTAPLSAFHANGFQF